MTPKNKNTYPQTDLDRILAMDNPKERDSLLFCYGWARFCDEIGSTVEEIMEHPDQMRRSFIIKTNEDFYIQYFYMIEDGQTQTVRIYKLKHYCITIAQATTELLSNYGDTIKRHTNEEMQLCFGRIWLHSPYGSKVKNFRFFPTG